MITNADFKGMLNMRRWIISEVIWYRHTVTTKQSNVVAYWIVSKKRKTPKTYLPVTSLQPRGYVAEWLRFFLVIVEGPVGCLPTVEFSCDFWQGSWGSPNLAQIFAYGKWLYPYRMLLHGASELRSAPNMSETCNSEDGYTFSPKCLRPYPQNQAKAPFWGTLRCKT